MNRWLIALLFLSLTGMAVHVPRLGSGGMDFAQLRPTLLALAPDLRVERFPEDPLLPEDYLYVVAGEQGPLLSAYVAYYPEQRMGAKAPHPPSLCYATQGYSTSPVERWRVSVDGIDAVVQTLLVERNGFRRLVVYWEHDLGRIPVARASSKWAYEPLERLLAGRSDLAWVRLEVRPRDGGFDREQVNRIVATLCRSVAAAMRAGTQ